MRRLLSIKYSAGAFNFAMLVLRIGSGVLMMNHGYQKLVNFAKYKTQFMSFLGMSPAVSLSLAIFAEFFCALFIVIGLFTRFASIPLIIAMSVALFMAHKGDVFGDGEHAALYLATFITILLLGPGRVSVDGMISK